MIHVFYGEDDFSIQEAVSDVKKGLGESSVLDSSATCLTGAKLRLDELQAAVQAMPFFGERRLVIVNGLLGRFEAKEKRYVARKPSKTPSGDAALHQMLADVINNAPDSTVVVLVDGDVSKSNLLLRSLLPKADIRAFAPIKGQQLEIWTRKCVEKARGKIDEVALKTLIQLVGGDLWVMHGEIEKLVLYTAGRVINSADVKKLVSLSREATIFTLVEAIIDRRLSTAQQSMRELLDTGSAPNYILVMLARQLRLMVRTKELKNSGQSEKAVQDVLKLADYPFRKTLEQAARYSMVRLHDLYHRLLETDLSIKTGKYGDELALTLLISEMCSQN